MSCNQCKMSRRRVRGISHYRRSSKSTGKHFSIRHQLHGVRQRRSRFADVMMAVNRGVKRVREPDYLSPERPTRYLRGVGGYGRSTGFGEQVYRAMSSTARAGQDLMGRVADAVRPVAEQLAYDSLRNAAAAAALYGGYRANALPAARY